MRTAGCLLLAWCAACGDQPITERDVVFERDDHWPAAQILPQATGPRLVFTNSGDDTLTFVDANSYALIGTIPVGFFPVEPEGPHHLQVSPDGQFLFVGISNYVERAAAATGPHGTHGTGRSDGYLLKIDARTGEELARTRVSKSPGDVRFEPTRRLIYQSHFDLASVIDAVQNNRPSSEFDSLLIGTDAVTMKKEVEIRICSAGHGIGFSSDGATAYVVCWMSDQLAVVDLQSRDVERVILGDFAGAPPAPRYQPYALGVSPNDGRVFISATGPGLKGLEIYDPAQAAMLPQARIPTTGAPQFGSFSGDGSVLFMVTQVPDRLLVVDPASSTITDDRDLTAVGCRNPHNVSLSPDESTLWIVCEGNRITSPGSFHALSRSTLEEIAEVRLGIFPDDVALAPMPSGDGS